MASAMRCRAHGRLAGDSCDVAGCLEIVEPDVETTVSAPVPCTAPECGNPVPCPLHPGGVTDMADREVAVYAAASAAAVDASPAPIEGYPVLRFPWGPISVPAGTLIVGRGHPESCGEPIEEYGNVSRRHALVTVCDGELFVEDQASTNGTTVNGVQIPAYERRALADGDTVGFGGELRAVVRVGGETP